MRSAEKKIEISLASTPQQDFPLLSDTLFTVHDMKDKKVSLWIADLYIISSETLNYEFAFKDKHKTPLTCDYLQQMRLLLLNLSLLLETVSVDLISKPRWIAETLGFLKDTKVYSLSEDKDREYGTFLNRLQAIDFEFLNEKACAQFYRDLKLQLEFALYTWTHQLKKAATPSAKSTVNAKIRANFEVLNRQFRQCVDGVNGFLISLSAELRDGSDFMSQIDALKSSIIADVVMDTTQIIEFFNPDADETELPVGEHWDGWNDWQVHVETLTNIAATEAKLGVRAIAESKYKYTESLQNRILFTEQILKSLLYPTFQRRFTVDSICQLEAERLTKLYWQKFSDTIKEFSAISNLSAEPKIVETDEKIAVKLPSFEQQFIARMQIFIELGFCNIENIILEKIADGVVKKSIHPQLHESLAQADKSRIQLFNLLLSQVEKNCLQQGYFTQSLAQQLGEDIKKITTDEDAITTLSKRLDKNGETELTKAIKQGKLLTVKTLLATGVNPNIPNAHGETPLLLAMRNRKTATELRQEAQTKCSLLSPESPYLSRLEALIPIQYIAQDVDHYLQDVLLNLLLSHSTIELPLEEKGINELIVASEHYSNHNFELLIKLLAKLPEDLLKQHQDRLDILLLKTFQNINLKKSTLLFENILFSAEKLDKITHGAKDAPYSFRNFLCLVKISKIEDQKKLELTKAIIAYHLDFVFDFDCDFKTLIKIFKKQMSAENFSILLKELMITLRKPEYLLWLKIQLPFLEINHPIYFLPEPNSLEEESFKTKLYHASQKDPKDFAPWLKDASTLSYQTAIQDMCLATLGPPITLLHHVIKKRNKKDLAELLHSHVDVLADIDDKSKTTPLMLVAQANYDFELFALLLPYVIEQCAIIPDKDEKQKKVKKFTITQHLLQQDERKATVFHYLLSGDEVERENQTNKLVALLNKIIVDWSEPPIKLEDSALKTADDDNTVAQMIKLLIQLASAEKEADYLKAYELFLTISADSINEYTTLLQLISKQCPKPSEYFLVYLSKQAVTLPCLLSLESLGQIKLEIDTPYLVRQGEKTIKDTLIFTATQFNKQKIVNDLLQRFPESKQLQSEVYRSLLQVLQKSTADQEAWVTLLLKELEPVMLLSETDTAGNLLLHHIMSPSCQFANFTKLMQIYMAKNIDSHEDKEKKQSTQTLSKALYQKNITGETPLSFLLEHQQKQKILCFLNICGEDQHYQTYLKEFEESCPDVFNPLEEKAKITLPLPKLGDTSGSRFMPPPLQQPPTFSASSQTAIKVEKAAELTKGM